MAENNFVFDLGGLINLQYITAYGERYITEHQEMMNDWPERFEHYRDMAEDFTKNEPDWDTSDVDYETAIEAFCKARLGY